MARTLSASRATTPMSRVIGFPRLLICDGLSPGRSQWILVREKHGGKIVEADITPIFLEGHGVGSRTLPALVQLHAASLAAARGVLLLLRVGIGDLTHD